MALHHKLCHTLGDSFNTPHSETHTIILSHALTYNAPNIPEVLKKLAEALSESQGPNVLLGKLKASRALRDYGLEEEHLDNATEIVVSNPYWNPPDFEKYPIREPLRMAWAG
jgi:alcohol dehydrogenase class IV